jgi:ABC-type lipoprotein export system ATPase subunit
MDSLFKIKSLHCAYKNGKDVLSIHNLDIPAHKLVILLGKSGCGKSTLLETLGLMNNTLTSGEIIYTPAGSKTTIKFSELWDNNGNRKVAKVRHDYFSFIFQNTNLMPNFSAYENACLTNLIRGKSLAEASGKVEALMNELDLEDISQTRKASELSGGQKQRLAFIRAIASDFDVLFGDEPTGNLDDINSRELIHFLKNNIKTNNRSAIIVTHNIPLSVEFGDLIILINTKTNGAEASEVFQENIFLKEDDDGPWLNHNKVVLTKQEMIDRITDIISNHKLK